MGEPILSNEKKRKMMRAFARALRSAKLGDRSSLRRADPCMVHWVVRESLFQARGLFDAARAVDPAARHLRQVVREEWGPIRSPFDAWIRRGGRKCGHHQAE